MSRTWLAKKGKRTAVEDARPCLPQTRDVPLWTRRSGFSWDLITSCFVRPAPLRPILVSHHRKRFAQPIERKSLWRGSFRYFQTAIFLSSTTHPQRIACSTLHAPTPSLESYPSLPDHSRQLDFFKLFSFYFRKHGRHTSVNVLGNVLRQRALHGLLRRLCLQLVAHGIAAAGIECALERVALPAEDVVAAVVGGRVPTGSGGTAAAACPRPSAGRRPRRACGTRAGRPSRSSCRRRAGCSSIERVVVRDVGALKYLPRKLKVPSHLRLLKQLEPYSRTLFPKLTVNSTLRRLPAQLTKRVC